MKQVKQMTHWLGVVLRSRRFTIGILCFFALQALWVAFSAVYPMAFDEDFHFGIIKIYSHHWLPFLPSQPNNASQFGAVYRDPSYLYHYLLSFPYRIIALITHNTMAQVITLRLLNIALFCLGLMLFYVLLRRVGASRLLCNGLLAIATLIPIAPLLAGQINYDNLLFPLVAWTCVLMIDVVSGLKAHMLRLQPLLLFVVVCLLTSLVKYVFLPIGFVASAYIAFAMWRAFAGNGGWKALARSASAAYSAVSSRAKGALLLALAVASILFVQRYGLNIITYHTPVPGCDTVLSADECAAYGPWARNAALAQSKGDFDSRILPYVWTWLQGMHYRLFFMISGPANGYVNYPPVPLPNIVFITCTIGGMVALVLYGRRLLQRRPFLWILSGIAAFYIIILWIDDYQQFLATGQPVAINGRYVLPIFLLAAVAPAMAVARALQAWNAVRIWVVAGALLLALQGGGVFSFILRSDASWDWPNRAVVHANNAARRILSPIMVEGSKYY